ncbi:MAG TPA: tRNA (adenosine(37)-N6)-dimethylallyltransferase MiaA [Verrucomicrobiae bacterium]|nr:tRNA (adenosine(37)-N6)-dimethylallyltransferase MiaA [Verrucomicrobiae bacterium]
MQTLFLVGPTAVGKTAVALELARRLNGEIVSADSMEVYRGMDIGTAKPTAAEGALVPHHLINVCEVSEVFDAKRFVDLANKAIADIHSRGKTALIVGGTGLYVRALRHGLFEGPSRNEQLRARLEAMTAPQLFEELQRLDPQTAKRIDRHNPRRLVRALEVFHETGKPISELQKEWKSPQRGPLPQGERRIPSPPTGGEGQGEAVAVCLTRERADLLARIERRIDEQIRAGWVDEVRRLMGQGLEENLTALQAAGYRELVAHLHGELPLDKAVALIKTRTRQLAKRQLTWFRREPGLQWLEIGREEQPTETARRVRDIFQSGRKVRHVEDA